MLSLKGITELIFRFLRIQVIVLRQTGNRIRAMLNLSVSAAPFAVDKQYPITSKAVLWRYWMNFQVKRTTQMSNQSNTIQACLQYDLKRISAFELCSWNWPWVVRYDELCATICGLLAEREPFDKLILKRVSNWFICRISLKLVKPEENKIYAESQILLGLFLIRSTPLDN